MKLRRLLAATAAAAVATSAMAVVASAAEYWAPGNSNNSGLIASWRTDDGTTPLFQNQDLVPTITKIEVVATAEDVEQVAEDVADGIWIGGALIVNSNSTGWCQWGFDFAAAGDTTVTIDEDAETITVVRDNGAPIFAADDTYCLVNLHDWANVTSMYKFEVLDVIPYNADGVDVRTLDGAVADEPVVDEPVVDEPVVDEPVVDEPVVDEPVVDEPVVDEPVVDEPAVDTDAPAADAGDKASPDTGVEGIAAVAGVVALAGVAVVASRKRK